MDLNNSRKGEIRELTASEMDIVTGGTKNLHLADITKAAAKAAANASQNRKGFDWLS